MSTPLPSGAQAESVTQERRLLGLGQLHLPEGPVAGDQDTCVSAACERGPYEALQVGRPHQQLSYPPEQKRVCS